MTWRPMILVMMLLTATVAPAAARPVGPGTGATCTAGTADVVLDPGHGGGDSGAVNSTYRLREADVNRDIACRTKVILESSNLTVALTRYGDSGLGNSDRDAIASVVAGGVLAWL